MSRAKARKGQVTLDAMLAILAIMLLIMVGIAVFQSEMKGISERCGEIVETIKLKTDNVRITDLAHLGIKETKEKDKTIIWR